MRQRLAAYTMLIAALATPASTSQGPLKSVIAKSILRSFEAQQELSIDEFLAARRPTPLDAAHRAKVMAALPKEGELRPRAHEIEKLDAAQKILVYHRRDGVITFKVIEIGHAFVGLHARAVLLASRDALALVNAEQFSALVAHELAHEYVWEEYWRAMQSGEHSRMQELELLCDGIAVLTLRRLGIDPEQLVSAVESMTRFNERRGTVASTSDYVSLKERVAFIRAVARLPWE
jgi:hypothetical protein